jgi:hypothetical protein
MTYACPTWEFAAETYILKLHIFVKRKQLEITLTKCNGYSDTSQNSLQTTNFSYTKQYSNQSGPTEYNSWGTASTSNIEILERF